MAPRNRIKLPSQLLLATIGFAIHTTLAQAAASAHWIQPQPTPRTGEAIEIVCRTEWPESDPSLNVLPAQSPSLYWGALQLLRTESGFEEGMVHVDHVFALTVAAPGTFTLPPLDIPYFDRGTPDRENMPTVQAPSLEIEVRQVNRALYKASAAAAVTAILAAIIIALRLRKTRAQSRIQTGQTKPNFDEARAALNRARTLRIDGDFYGCYKAMAEAVSVIGAAQESLTADLTARAQAAGYSGSRPDDTLLDSDFRAVERAIAQAAANEELDLKTTANQNEVAKP